MVSTYTVQHVYTFIHTQVHIHTYTHINKQIQIESTLEKRLSLENTELEVNATLTSLSCADSTGHGIVSKKFTLFVFTLHSTDS